MAITEAMKNRWAEIDAVVREHRVMLREQRDHRKLRAFAVEQGWDNGSDFAAFKRSLVKIRVNYEQVREETFARAEGENAQRAEQLAQMGDDLAEVWLWVAAEEDKDSGEGAFAIVDIEDDPVWYGAFHDEDRVRQAGDLVSAEQSVAEKAVWVAHKALEACGHEVGRLHVTTMCPQLDEEKLRAAGAKKGVAVVVHVDEADERALTMAQTPGFMGWQERDLTELVATDE